MLNGNLPVVPTLLLTAASADVAYPVPLRYVLRKPLHVSRLLLLVAELVKTSSPLR
jgi:hypothetical protein